MLIRLPFQKFASLFLLLAVSPSLYAGPFQLLLESDTNGFSGNEIFLADYANYQDLINATLSSSGFSQIDIGTGFSVGFHISFHNSHKTFRIVYSLAISALVGTIDSRLGRPVRTTSLSTSNSLDITNLYLRHCNFVEFNSIDHAQLFVLSISKL